MLLVLEVDRDAGDSYAAEHSYDGDDNCDGDGDDFARTIHEDVHVQCGDSAIRCHTDAIPTQRGFAFTCRRTKKKKKSK